MLRKHTELAKIVTGHAFNVAPEQDPSAGQIAGRDLQLHQAVLQGCHHGPTEGIALFW